MTQAGSALQFLVLLLHRLATTAAPFPPPSSAPETSHFGPGPKTSHFGPGPKTSHFGPGPETSHFGLGPETIYCGPWPETTYCGLWPETIYCGLWPAHADLPLQGALHAQGRLRLYRLLQRPPSGGHMSLGRVRAVHVPHGGRKVWPRRSPGRALCPLLIKDRLWSPCPGGGGEGPPYPKVPGSNPRSGTTA